MLEELRTIIASPTALSAAAKWSFDFSSVWPMDELAGCGMEKIGKFVRHRLG